MNRRNLLRATALAVPAIALAGCSTAQIQTIEARALADLQLLASGLSAFGPLFAAVTGVSVAAIASVQAIIADIASAVSTISAATTQAAAQPIVTQIEGYVSSLLTIAGQYALPAGLANILAAAKALLPVIEAAVGIIVAAAPAGGMTADQARAILKAA